MLKAILRSFAYGYGRTMGRKAAHATGWLAIPLLILVVMLGLMELMGVRVSLWGLLPYHGGLLPYIGGW